MSNKLENIDLLLYTLERPKLFSIHNVEGFFLFFSGYTIGKEDSQIHEFLSLFNTFIKKKCSKTLKDIDSARIIRLYSADDSHSLELLKSWVEEFIDIKYPEYSNLQQ